MLALRWCSRCYLCKPKSEFSSTARFCRSCSAHKARIYRRLTYFYKTPLDSKTRLHSLRRMKDTPNAFNTNYIPRPTFNARGDHVFEVAAEQHQRSPSESSQSQDTRV